MAVVLLLAGLASAFSASSYYIVIDTLKTGGLERTLIIRRGQPPLKLPGLDQELVDTGFAEGLVEDADRSDIANGMRWGFWLQKTNSGYAEWAQQFGEALCPVEYAQWLWYLGERSQALDTLIAGSRFMQGCGQNQDSTVRDASTVRLAAAGGLGAVGVAVPDVAPQAVAGLVELLGDDDWNVRSAAAGGLGAVGAAVPDVAPQAVARLVELLGDDDANVRSAAASALAAAYAAHYRHGDQQVLLGKLVNPLESLERPIAARALFLIVLKHPGYEDTIRQQLGPIASSPAPIARVWANKTFAMLDLIDLAHETVGRRDTKQQIDTTSLYRARNMGFFGEEYTWAAWQALNWMESHEQMGDGR